MPRNLTDHCEKFSFYSEIRFSGVCVCVCVFMHSYMCMECVCGGVCMCTFSACLIEHLKEYLLKHNLTTSLQNLEPKIPILPPENYWRLMNWGL